MKYGQYLLYHWDKKWSLYKISYLFMIESYMSTPNRSLIYFFQLLRSQSSMLRKTSMYVKVWRHLFLIIMYLFYLKNNGNIFLFIFELHHRWLNIYLCLSFFLSLPSVEYCSVMAASILFVLLSKCSHISWLSQYIPYHLQCFQSHTFKTPVQNEFNFRSVAIAQTNQICTNDALNNCVILRLRDD